MGMTYDSPLLTTAAQVAHLTGRQQLGNLESADFELEAYLLEAHRWVYERLANRWGRELATITNENYLRRAVAYKVVDDLVKAGILELADGLDVDHYLLEAKDMVDSFHPTYPSGQENRVASEDLPCAGNFENGMHFVGSDAPTRTYRATKPRRIGS